MFWCGCASKGQDSPKASPMMPLWNSHDPRRPELKMFGSMPWCCVPIAKARSKAVAKELSYGSLNLIHEFASLFSPKAYLCRVCLGTPLWTLHRTAKVYCSNECWLKGGEGEVCWVQCDNMGQDCSLTAVQRKTAFVEQSWFMMAWT